MKIKFNELSADEVSYLKYKSLYYKGEDTISDFEFDALEDKLRVSGSDVINIIGHIIIEKDRFTINKEKIKFVRHETPMLSLDKVKFTEDYVPFKELKSKFLDKIDTKSIIECSPKLDGNAISIKYENGNLSHIASRGNGEEGQDYTKLNLNVPKYIEGFSGEVRGEAVIDLEIFNTKYGEQSNLEVKYTNARNFVAGSLSKGDSNIISDIDFIAFNTSDILSYDNEISFLKNVGFKTLENILYCDNKISEREFISLYNDFEKYRSSSKYQLDGFVMKYDYDVREEIGSNNHHPFWAIAVKFKPEVKKTRVIDIEYSLGKNGQLTPVAILEPIELMNSIRSRVTLYNIKWLISNKVGIGSVVSLIKSGDIIPKITEILETSENFNIPTEYNGKKTEIIGTELIVDDYKNLSEYKSVMLSNALNILGVKNIGLSTTNRLINANIDLLDILTKDPISVKNILLESREFKESRELDIIIEEFSILKKVELYKLIHSMGYNNCGESIAKQIANMISGIEYDFKGLNKEVIDSFLTDDTRINNIRNICDMMNINNIEIIYPINTKDLITFEMTGTNPSGESKKSYKERMEKLGALHTSLKSNTDYLVVDDINSKSSKMKSAIKYGTKIITYSDFEKKMGS